MNRVLTSKQKALQINLDSNIYGIFAEIGAGQETVRHFFRAGGASGTIAKAMSAYDKDFSNAIYGAEKDLRYVTETRLKKMLKLESNLMEARLNRKDHPKKTFFSYANTVATIDFSKTFKGHGWVGIRFQLGALEKCNEIIAHVRFKENDAKLQQETLGILGVNLIHGSFFKHDTPKELLKALYDNLDKDQIEVDMINFSGPRFMYVDNRLMSLQLVKNEMTKAVIFGPDGNNILPAQLLYKKNILAIRGSFRPVTKVNMDMLQKGYEQFSKTARVSESNTQVLFEITLNNLKSLKSDIDERDFLDRANILCSLGHTVLISDFSEYYKLIDYFSMFTSHRMGLIMGVNSLLDVFNEKYYRELSGGILEAFGKLFARDLKIFLYPLKKSENTLLNSDNLRVHPRLKELYKYFKFNGRIVDIKNSDAEILNYFSRRILQMIEENESGWEKMLPDGVANIIKEKHLFGYYPKMIIE